MSCDCSFMLMHDSHNTVISHFPIKDKPLIKISQRIFSGKNKSKQLKTSQTLCIYTYTDLHIYKWIRTWTVHNY